MNYLKNCSEQLTAFQKNILWLNTKCKVLKEIMSKQELLHKRKKMLMIQNIVTGHR